MAATNPSSSLSSSPTSALTKLNGKGRESITGFVLKLNNMVNGAPDDIVSWLPSGEAFRISDLPRLESETLPQYFRHNRFQSLVRQLNFYNFRKVNRERMFWVYHHPLFHRDRPEEMHKLRRRTCPGYDGRKNRSEDQDLSTSLDAATSDTWSNGDEMIQIKESAAGKEGTPAGGLLFSSAAREVSRSPSPSNSPTDHARVGRGSVRDSATFVSEEERSPSDVKNNMGRRVSSLTASYAEDITMEDSHSELQRIVINEVKMNEYFIPLQAEDDEANDLPVTKKSKKANQAFIISSDSENEYAGLSHQETRKKFTKEELLERQDHNQTVSEISRDLNEIAAGMAEGTSRGRGKGRGRLGTTPSQAVRTTSASPVFGFDKPHDYYSGAGKCDLLTYDGFDGFIVDEDNRECKEKSVVFPSMIAKEVKQASVDSTPPSLCPSVNQSLTEACLEGTLVSSTSTFDRTLAAAILSFCLPNHPEDPNLAMKIIDHLKTRPMLAHEFELYRKAMSPDYNLDGKLIHHYHFICTSEDLRRDWKMFSTNFINRVCLAYNLQTLVENEAIVACNSCWFKEG